MKQNHLALIVTDQINTIFKIKIVKHRGKMIKPTKNRLQSTFCRFLKLADI
jgi:hypothetical protein